MQAVQYERRKLRSTHINRAIGYLFETIASAHEVSNMALADSRGLLLVHHGDETHCDVLSAYAPLMTRTVDPTTREHILGTMSSYIPEASPERISVREFFAHGERMYLCAQGTPSAAKDVAVCRAISGARRILN